MGPKILLLLCFAVALRPVHCEPKSTDDDERARLPEFLTELDLAGLEASEEDIEALKTVVKRLAPEKNGVMGQPGVDFPALTTIPATSFSCRGLKGGYYADLETNCQVFHICDNGRKISFLCPNGTIFQQSQLICDWWFKVDCSKSTELYEQSAEQLAEEERKRSDAKRMKSEFHRSSGENDDNSGGQNFYQSGNSNYDGRQNGRTNPFGQSSGKNQIQGQRGQNVDTKSSVKPFDPSQIFASSGATGNQYNQINDLAASNVYKVAQNVNQNGQNGRQQQQQQQNQTPSSRGSSSDRGAYRAVDRQQNQLEGATREEKRQFNYEQRGASKFSGSNQNGYQNQQQQQAGRPNQQPFDYSSANRNGGRDNDRRNFGKSSTIGGSDYELSSNRVTPSYTETTTFRTSTPSPIREYQQLAESAAFASNRGNRFNDAYSSSQFNSYYNFNNGNGNNGNNPSGDNGSSGNNNNSNSNSKPRVQPTEKPRQKSITPTPSTDKTPGSVLRVRGGSSALPFPTFQPIYKPRTSNTYSSASYEATTPGGTFADATTTNAPYTDGDYYTQTNQERTTAYAENLDYTTTPAYPTNQDYQPTTESPVTDVFTEDYQGNSVTPGGDRTAVTGVDFFENTTPTIITSGSYVNAKTYASQRALGTSGNPRTSDSYTSPKPHSKSQENRQNSVATAGPANDPTVRRSDATSRQFVTTSPSNRDVTVDGNAVSASLESRGAPQGRALSSDSPRANTPSGYRASPNSLGTSTEKPSRSSSTAAFQLGSSTGKTLSPYDTSITYQQGKVMSTLGPYVPFTKNYAYSTTTTSTTAKPPAYTATVPTYSSTASVYRTASAKGIAAKVRGSSVAPPRLSSRLRSGSAAYLPEKKPDTPAYLAKKHNLSERPPTEREHAMSMLQSLRGLEGTAPSVIPSANSTRSGLNIPTSSGPSTLHSLALYFATASDDYDAGAESRTDSAAESESGEAISAKVIADKSPGVELPRSILTQHTISSYAELFNLNNALEGNSSAEGVLDGDLGDVSAEDDLDLQQSEGPIDGVRKSNSTKLRELAQVFTHALSAYLQDPDTFKKILTEIRPTEPSVTDEEGGFTATTYAPTTLEDYPSVTKEKDEVLDFSDDTTPPRPRRPPTTIYPPTTTTDATDFFTTSGDFYTTPGGDAANNRSANDFAFQVNHAFGNNANGNELSGGSGSGATGSGGLYYPEEATGPSGPTALGGDALNDYSDNYFPSDDAGVGRIGGFQNNTATAVPYEPYGRHVQPYGATPIGDNYVASSTPASYVQSYRPQVSRTTQRYNRVIENSTPPQSFPRVTSGSRNSVASSSGGKSSASGARKGSLDRKSPTTEPFRIRYYDPTTSKPSKGNRESLVTAGTVYSNFRNSYGGHADRSNRNDLGDRGARVTERPSVETSVVTSKTIQPATTTRSVFTETPFDAAATTTPEATRNRPGDGRLNDHWTSSPTVTQLWESTVFVDPKRINQGLVSGETSTIDLGTMDYTEVTERGVATGDANRHESLVTDATSSGATSRNANTNNNNNNNIDYPSSPWQWSTGSIAVGDDDSPTAFTLLPQTGFTSERSVAAATPPPIYTTRSSITTTITSSVTSTSAATIPPKSPASGRPRVENDKDNEVTMAHSMFGGLNTTSTKTLMKVMQQADTNATVRQLVLLLINHCNGPMNKTMEEEKEQLLEALLRMPVNEFTSEESRDLVEGIDRLNLPIGRTTTTTAAPATSSPPPAATTFRGKKGRRFKSNAEDAPAVTGRAGEDMGTAETTNTLAQEDTAASDARALELLRSLYTIAAKWG